MAGSYHDRLRVAVGHVRRVQGLLPGEKSKLCDLTLNRCPVSIYARCVTRPVAKGLEAGMKIANNHPDFGGKNEGLARKAEREAQTLEDLYGKFVDPLCAFERALGKSFEEIATDNDLNSDLRQK